MKSNYKALLTWLVPILIVSGLTFYTGINLGVEYADSNVVQIKSSEVINENNLKSSFAEIGKVSKIEVFEDNTYSLFFQNVNLDVLEGFETKSRENFSAIQQYEVFVHEPTTLILIGERIVYAVSFVALIYLILILWVFKKKELSRNAVLGIVFVDFLNFLSLLVFLAGLLNLLSYLNVQLNAWLITVGIGFMFSLLSINLNMSIIAKENPGLIVDRWKEASIKFIEIGLKYYLLLSFILFSVLFFDTRYIFVVVVFILGLFYSLFLFIRHKIFLLLIWESITEISKSSKSFFSKDW